MRKLFNRLRGEDGQALVELAFVIPLVLLLLFAIIDFGLALNQQNQDTNIANIAAREAAVYSSGTPPSCGSASPDTSLAQWANCESLADGGPALTSVCVYDTNPTQPNDNTYSSGDSIEVKVQSSFAWGKLVGVTGLPSSIGANATMRLETSGVSGTSPSFYTLSNSWGTSACPTTP